MSWRLCRHLAAPEQASFDISHSALQTPANCCDRGLSHSMVSGHVHMLQVMFLLWSEARVPTHEGWQACTGQVTAVMPS